MVLWNATGRRKVNDVPYLNLFVSFFLLEWRRGVGLDPVARINALRNEAPTVVKDTKMDTTS